MSFPMGLATATGDHGEPLARAVEIQVSVLTTADSFLVLFAVGIVLALLVLLLPVRTYPPRILFAKH
jgi:DHA2 family multidrug resistance protein